MVRTIACVVLALACWLPANGFAQSVASLGGTVTDESKAVLPGVTVTATEISSGRSYASVTDDRGQYRLPSIVPGIYRIDVELSGFGTVRVPRVELLVGQQAEMPFSLKVASVAETVTVVGEAPLINTQSAVVGGNIDRRQMQDLPALGRNWLDLSLLAKGITANTVTGQRAGVQRDDQFQLNLDGQQITQNISLSDSFGQPALSREAIQEFALNTSGYDVTQGRSVGVTVQAISRSGTNDLHGSVYGNFRNDKFNAKDFFAQRVLPFSNTQTGFSLGGPILQNKLHYFGTYEYERQPDTTVLRPNAYAALGIAPVAFDTMTRQHNMLARVDYQAGTRDHVNVRGTFWDQLATNANLGGTSFGTSAADSPRQNLSIIGNWSRVINNNIVQEIRAGYTQYEFANQPAAGVAVTPVYTFTQGGLPDIGHSRSFPQAFFQNTPSIRYDLTVHHNSHDFKIGGEFLARKDGAFWPNQARGIMYIDGRFDSNGKVVPLTFAEFTSRFPLTSWNDSSKWDLSGLHGTRWVQNFANDFNVDLPRKTWAIWAADTWAASNRLTLNYGIRWDVDWGALSVPGGLDYPVIISNGFDPPNTNFGYRPGIRDLTNVAPRGGITYKLTDTLVLRGGAGLFYNFQESNMLTGPQQQITNERHVVSVDIPNSNPGRADFFTNPLGALTEAQILQLEPGQGLPPVALRTLAPNFKNPRTLQITGGFQKQVGEVFGFDSDVLYSKGMHISTDRDVNLFYDPATGYPKNLNYTPPGATAPIGRPNTAFGNLRYWDSVLGSEQVSLANSFTRRMRNHWQAGGTYTLTFKNEDQGSSGFGYIAGFNNPFCLTCENGTSTAFQRHTVRLNALYQAPWGINVSGIYSFGSGNRFGIGAPVVSNLPVGIGPNVYGSFGTNRYVGQATLTMPSEVTFPDGSVHDVTDLLVDGTATTYTTGQELPRNAGQALAYSKLDLRLTKAFSIPGTSVKITGIAEVFNLLNHANWGGYSSTINSTFARPTSALTPRTGQLAFRVDF